MGFVDNRTQCYEWFDKTYKGKLGIIAFENAFREVALAAWCASKISTPKDIQKLKLDTQNKQIHEKEQYEPIRN